MLVIKRLINRARAGEVEGSGRRRTERHSIRPHRLVTIPAVALAVVAGAVGCSSEPPARVDHGALPPNTARLVIDGQDMGTTRDVVCTQVGWAWTVNVGNSDSGATAVFETGADPLTARSVRLRNIDGFSGAYWDGNRGQANASMNDGAWTITGKVEGFNTDTPSIDRAERTFTIAANC
ncbi:lipoprotein LpqH [Mycolicibacterium hodleri]|nr:lipoprotein LpqH [Mycolicibacterium hodleri]